MGDGAKGAKTRGFAVANSWFVNKCFLNKVLTIGCDQLLVVSILYSANVGIALMALSSLNIAMYSTFKRLTVAVVLVGEYLVLNKTPSRWVVLSVMLMSVGVIVAGLGDVSFSLVGYSTAALSCIVQASYLIIVAKKEKELGMNSFTLLHYNSILSLPFVLVVGALKGEWLSCLEYPRLTEPVFIFNFCMACILGAILNYSIFVCTVVTSPLTLTVSGQVKSVITIIIGFFTFGGVQLTLLNAIGMSLNTAASASYSTVKYLEKSRASELPSTNGDAKSHPTSPTVTTNAQHAQTAHHHAHHRH